MVQRVVVLVQFRLSSAGCPLYSGIFAGHDPTRGSGHGVLKVSRVGSGQEGFKSRGSGQVGSIVLQISRVGSGRVENIFNFHGSGQVGSRGDEKLTNRVRS